MIILNYIVVYDYFELYCSFARHQGAPHDEALIRESIGEIHHEEGEFI